MEKKPERNDHVAAGLGLLAAAAYLCLKGLQKVEERLKRKK